MSEDFTGPDFSIDKRRYLRYEVLDYAVVHSDGLDNPINTVIVDIGLGGLQLRSKSALKVGTRCKIAVGRTDMAPLMLRGEVRHNAEIGNSDLIATGIRFTPESHDERMAVAEFVHKIFQRQCDLMAV